MIQNFLLNNFILSFGSIISKLSTFLILALVPMYLESEVFNFQIGEMAPYIFKILILSTFVKVIGGAIGDFITSSKWAIVGGLGLIALSFLCFTSETEGMIDFGLFLYVVGIGLTEPNINAHAGRINFKFPNFVDRYFLINSLLLVLGASIVTFITIELKKLDPALTSYNFDPNGLLVNRELSHEKYIESIRFIFNIMSFFTFVASFLIAVTKSEVFNEKHDSQIEKPKFRAWSIVGLILAPIGYTLMFTIITGRGGFTPSLFQKDAEFIDFLLKNEALIVGIPVVVLFSILKIHNLFKLMFASFLGILLLAYMYIGIQFTPSGETNYIGYILFGIIEALFIPTVFSLIYRIVRPKYFGLIYGASIFVSSFFSIILIAKLEMESSKLFVIIGLSLVLTAVLSLVGILIKDAKPETGLVKDSQNLDDF